MGASVRASGGQHGPLGRGVMCNEMDHDFSCTAVSSELEESCHL